VSTSAYILMNVNAGKAKEIQEIIGVIDDVKSIDTVSGPYDLIAIIETSDHNRLAKIVVEEIQSIDGVEKTITCNVLNI